jgi:enoyl-[acyl-carrier protein] reductase II
VTTLESSAHQSFKDEVVAAGEGATRLSLKALTPVRLLDNAFAREVVEAENAGQSPEELKALLGRGRAKKGMFEGDLDNGELEIGQVSSLIQAVKPAAEVMTELVEGYSSLTRGMEDPRFRWA